MADLGLETGSIDLIRTPDGRTVFLEINPVGQFGMISHPCNYNLERVVAEHLIERDDRAA
jgi:glutathione synthase/RimK-type ligase-like ATP-grasp enzyme